MFRLLLVCAMLVLMGCKPGVYGSFPPGHNVQADEQPQAHLTPPQPSK